MIHPLKTPAELRDAGPGPRLLSLRLALWTTGAGGLLWPDRATAAAPHPGNTEIQDRLAKILARPEFSSAPHESWLGRWLASFFRWLGGLHQTAPLLYWVLLIGCLALLVLITGHILWTVWRVLSLGPAPQKGDETRARQERFSRAYREEGRRCAERGEYTEAIRFLFLALVFRFEESGRVLFQRAFTNREYLALFSERPQVRAQLEVFVDTLDDHWYGQRPTDQGRYEECLRLFEGFERIG
jgi:hypothetical protein